MDTIERTFLEKFTAKIDYLSQYCTDDEYEELRREMEAFKEEIKDLPVSKQAEQIMKRYGHVLEIAEKTYMGKYILKIERILFFFKVVFIISVILSILAWAASFG